MIRVKNVVSFIDGPLNGSVEYEIESNESVSTAVVCAVSAVEGREPASLRPLTHVLEPDALDTLFGSRSSGEPRTGGRLSFIYSRCRVTVDNDEYLTVQPLETRPPLPGDREFSYNDSG